MNARVDIAATQLRVTMSGWDVLWTLRKRLVVPLEHVKGASADAKVASHGPWLGAGRTDALLDYAVAAGPMLVHGRHEFWDVHHPERTISIDLEGEPFARLVLEVSDPAAVIAAVNAAVATARSAA